MRNPTFTLTGTDADNAFVAESILRTVQTTECEEITFRYTKPNGGGTSTRVILGTDYSIAGDEGTNKRHVIATTPDGVRTFNLMGMTEMRWSLA